MNMNGPAGVTLAILRLYPDLDLGRMELCALYSRPCSAVLNGDKQRRLLSRRFDGVLNPDLNARSERAGADANRVLPAANPAHIRHKELNNTMHPDTGVNANTRGPPSPGRVICPF